MLFNFVLVWLYNNFDLSVSDESYVGVLNYNPGTFDTHWIHLKSFFLYTFEINTHAHTVALLYLTSISGTKMN